MLKMAGAVPVGATLVEARDAATNADAPRGIRLEPDGPVSRLPDGTIDPSVHLVSSRIVPLDVPPPYRSGRVSIVPGWAYPAALTGGRPCLVLEESPGRWEPTSSGYAWMPNEPTTWAWNLRVGEKITIGTGASYTICGPMAILPGDGNPEQFINYGPDGTGSGITRTYTSPDGKTKDASSEVLLLVNGKDDDGDGYIDEGWDGFDNEPNGVVDNIEEWEREVWSGPQATTTTDVPYLVRRRPVPSIARHEVKLPGAAIVDLTGWDGRPERSRTVVDRYSGRVNILLDSSGRFSFDSPYGVRTGVRMDRAAFLHLWIGSRGDVSNPVSPMPPPKEDARLLTIASNGRTSVHTIDPLDPSQAFNDARFGTPMISGNGIIPDNPAPRVRHLLGR